MCDRAVERALAEQLAAKTREVEQLRGDLTAARLQLAAAATAYPNVSPAADWRAWKRSAARARALLELPRTPLLRLPHPRIPGDDA